MDICVCLKLSKNKLMIKSKQIEVASVSSVFVPFVLTQTWRDEYLYLFLAKAIVIRAAFKEKTKEKNESKEGCLQCPYLFI